MKQLLQFVICSLLFTFVACKGNEKETKQIDAKDLFEKSENYSEDKLKKKDSLRKFIPPKHSHDTVSNLDKVLFEDFPEIKELLDKKESKFFIDRLGPKNKLVKHLQIDSAQCELIAWNFEDSIKTENAFFNWLDCFGEDCKSFRVGASVRFSEKSTYLWVGQQHIVYVRGEDNLNQTEVSRLINTTFSENWKYVVSQKARRRAKWLVLPPNVETANI